VIALVAVVAAVVALGLVLVLGRRIQRMRRALRGRRAQPRGEAPDEPEMNTLEMAGLREQMLGLEETVAHAVQCVGVVRFDAFEDLGGMQSFSVAMLDQQGSGVVFSSINGRNETRIYAKPIERGASQYHLSNEEQEAIRRAIASRYRSS